MLREVSRLTAVAAFGLIVACSWGVTGKICIDAGHGGTDSGATGNGQLEKTNTLNSSLKFKAWLDKDTNDGAGGGSWNIVMTRSTDVYVSLQGRCDISNNNSCNRFMCIHNNAYDGSANGTETFSVSSTGTGADLRNKVQTRMIQAWARYNRGVKTANYYVLVNTAAPAELAELAFIDNAADSAYTGSSSWQDVAGKYQMYALQEHYGLTAYTPQTAQTIIVDNGGTGYTSSANWWDSTSTAGWYGSNYQARATEAVSDAAQWSFNVTAPGNYTIYAWWTAGANRAAAAPYILPNGTTVNKNQQANGGSWQTLGTVSLAAGTNTVRLSCWTTAGYYVIADAVKAYGPQ